MLLAVPVLPMNWRNREFTITWRQATRIDWGTLLPFGGGLSLGLRILLPPLGLAQGSADMGMTHPR